VILAALFSLACATPGQGTTPTAPPPLPRVLVETDPENGDGALRDRLQSVKDLRSALLDKKKRLVVVDDRDRADLVITVVERTTTIPRIRIGLTPPGTTGPVRAVRLRVTLTRSRIDDQDGRVEFTNKNTPFENARGWTAAADDLAQQIEKWIVAHWRATAVSPGRARSRPVR
jgi:hypothetical protein